MRSYRNNNTLQTIHQPNDIQKLVQVVEARTMVLKVNLHVIHTVWLGEKHVHDVNVQTMLAQSVAKAIKVRHVH